MKGTAKCGRIVDDVSSSGRGGGKERGGWWCARGIVRTVFVNFRTRDLA